MGKIIQFYIAKIQIFLIVFRNFNNIINIVYKKDIKNVKLIITISNQIVIY